MAIIVNITPDTRIVFKEKILQINKHSGSQDQSFKCTICCSDFSTLLNLQRHYATHIHNKPFKCKNCNEDFLTQGELHKHEHMHIFGSQFFCDYCQTNFISKFHLNEHRQRYHSEDLTCNACFRTFSNKVSLHRHELIHTSLKDGNLAYPCVICKTEFVYKRDLEGHLNTHEKIRNHWCKECEQTFFFSYLLKKHNLSHNNNQVCNVCYDSFTNKPLLQDHEKTHLRVEFNIESSVCYACDMCDNLTFPFKAALESHYNNDHVPYSRFPCKMCKETFFFSYLCKKHLVAHEEGKPHKCDKCNKMFRKMFHLTQHMKIHNQHTQCICPLCGKGFSSRWLLKKHSIVHTNNKPFACDFCNASFSRQVNLEKHYLVHMHEKEFKCKSCGATFTRKTAFVSHLKLHTADSTEGVKCIACDEIFVSQRAASRHTKKRHPELSLKTIFTCKICCKVMKHQPSYSKHMKIHTGDRPYKCDYCNKTFIQKRHLVSHHSNNHPALPLTMPYKCPVCDEGYILEGKLSLHISRCHSDLNAPSSTSEPEKVCVE